SSASSASSVPVIVGIGASAGGLEALESFFQSTRESTGMAFVVIQHLSPEHASSLPEILARHTSMPVTQAEDGTRIAPDHVYVIPVEAMPDHIVTYAAQLADSSDGDRSVDSAPQGGESQIGTICAIVQRKTGHDFRRYKRAPIVRRIQRRMHVVRAGSFGAYI